MAFIDTLINQGFVPGGIDPKIIREPGGKPEFGKFKSTSARVVGRILDLQQKAEDRQKKIEEKRKKKTDMYRTLRDAGYTSEKAFDAVFKGIELDEAPGESLEDQKDKAEIEKTKAETKKIITPKAKKLDERIKEKVATMGFDSLTPGEKKVYNDTIKKKEKTGDPFLDKTSGDDDDDKVAVFKPDGTPGFFDKDKWEAKKQTLLRKGWRLRS